MDTTSNVLHLIPTTRTLPAAEAPRPPAGCRLLPALRGQGVPLRQPPALAPVRTWAAEGPPLYVTAAARTAWKGAQADVIESSDLARGCLYFDALLFQQSIYLASWSLRPLVDDKPASLIPLHVPLLLQQFV